MNFKNELNQKIEIIDLALKDLLNSYSQNEYLSRILDSMNYSLFNGGKRIRPVLAIKAFDLFDTSGDYSDVLPYAMAIEMIHTYSLIHDDLPAMDDDSIRRGQATNHIRYGEAMAILAGDGLLNLAFETVSQSLKETLDKPCITKRKILALEELSRYSGIEGMIGGQVVDLHLLEEDASPKSVHYMYQTKTAALIMSSLVTGAILGGADDLDIESIRDFGLNLGLAYQIKDDFLDLEEDQAISKITYLSTNGLEKSKKDLEFYTEKSIKYLESLDKNKDIGFLLELSKALADREI